MAGWVSAGRGSMRSEYQLVPAVCRVPTCPRNPDEPLGEGDRAERKPLQENSAQMYPTGIWVYIDSVRQHVSGRTSAVARKHVSTPTRAVSGANVNTREKRAVKRSYGENRLRKVCSYSLDWIGLPIGRYLCYVLKALG